ncbi:MAG: hypothetical protein HY072_05365, partial [Deltaproteobacteria bacterium]|nr:hypothetical protein [Deltaproteobacteria bacterium]
MMYKNFIYLIPVIIAITVGGLLSCATTKKIFAIDSESKSAAPIQNPFPEESLRKQEKADNIIIRTKKGDRAIEVEL